MNHLRILGSATTLLLALCTASAQEPIDPVAPFPEADAMVRFVHLAPNAAAASVSLRGTDEGAATLTPDELADLRYADTSDYLPIPPGQYDVVVSPVGAEAGAAAGADRDIRLQGPAIEHTVTFGSDRYYTVVIMGLVLPPEVAEAEEGGGFLEWLRDLFTGAGGADGDVLDLRLEVIQDDPFATLEPDTARVRAVHAAPGTTNLDLAVAGERGTLVRNMGFGDVSRTIDLAPGETTLEIRATGSRAVVVDLSELDLSPGMIHTIMIIGTPIEAVPLEAVVVSDTPAPATGLTPVDPFAAPAEEPAEPADPAAPDEEPAEPDDEPDDEPEGDPADGEVEEEEEDEPAGNGG